MTISAYCLKVVDLVNRGPQYAIAHPKGDGDISLIANPAPKPYPGQHDRSDAPLTGH
jgi:hypothetical protein